MRSIAMVFNASEAESISKVVGKFLKKYKMETYAIRFVYVILGMNPIKILRKPMQAYINLNVNKVICVWISSSFTLTVLYDL